MNTITFHPSQSKTDHWKSLEFSRCYLPLNINANDLLIKKTYNKNNFLCVMYEIKNNIDLSKSGHLLSVVQALTVLYETKKYEEMNQIVLHWNGLLLVHLINGTLNETLKDKNNTWTFDLAKAYSHSSDCVRDFRI